MLHTLPLTQFSHLGHDYLEVFPNQSTPGQDDVIEFYVPYSGTTYLDPSSMFLYVRGRVVRKDGNDAATVREANDSAPDAVVPIDNFSNSMFKEVDVYLGSKLVSNHEHYTYRSYLDLLMFSNATMQATTLWPLMFTNRDTGEITEDASKSGESERFEMTKRSKEFECYTPIFTDLAHQGKLLPNGVDLRLVFHQNTNDFRLLTTETATTYQWKFVISKIRLFIRRVTFSPSVILAHNERLATDPALYLLRGIETKQRALLKGSTEFHFENLCPERLPARITFLFIPTAAFQGDYKKDPLQFSHLNLKRAVLSVGTKEYADEFDFEKQFFARPYLHLLRHFGNPQAGYSKENFKKKFLLHYMLNPDCSMEH